MGKILITGGAGFIGCHLAEYLAGKGHVIELIDNLSRGKKDSMLKSLCEHDSVRFIEGSLLDTRCIEGMDTGYDYIYHLAAIIGVSNVLESPSAVLHDNVQLLFNALKLAYRQKHLKRFIFASTSEVYAGASEQSWFTVPTPEHVPLVITHLKHPRTSYMLSKIYGEALCHQTGIPFSIIRPHNIYGPRMGMAHVIPELLQRAYNAKNGSELGVYSIDHSRTFCYISDAVKMINFCAEIPECEGEVFNIGRQQDEIKIADLATLIIEIVGKKLTIKPLPSTPGSPFRRCPDMTKTIRFTGFKAIIPLREGIEDTYRWYKNELFDTQCGGACS